ncbi:MAG: transcriptional repressor [Clostridia bacterium]|nr:transcriptional repressor [Clostridia bacterium]
MAAKAGYQTRAREDILAYLKTTPGIHHTATELKEHFDAEGHPIGTATIYRQLERYVDEGYIQKYFIGIGDSACYAYESPCDGGSIHFHMKCDGCGKLIHLDCDEMKDMQSHLLEHHGFQWNPAKTVFYGLCDRCRQAGA